MTEKRVEEYIKEFQKFFKEEYYAKIIENTRKDKGRITINFNDLSKHNPELAEELLDKPEETIQYAEAAIEEFDLQEGSRKLKLRIRHLPQSSVIRLRDLRAKDLDRFICVEGTIIR